MRAARRASYCRSERIVTLVPKQKGACNGKETLQVEIAGCGGRGCRDRRPGGTHGVRDREAALLRSADGGRVRSGTDPRGMCGPAGCPANADQRLLPRYARSWREHCGNHLYPGAACSTAAARKPEPRAADCFSTCRFARGQVRLARRGDRRKCRYRGAFAGARGRQRRAKPQARALLSERVEDSLGRSGRRC